MKQQIKRFNAQDLKDFKDKVVTLKFNEIVYFEFKKIMKEQGLVPSNVLNQFMKLTNELLKSSEGGEVVFIFEPDKKQEKKKK